jgi:hypothetical protein
MAGKRSPAHKPTEESRKLVKDSASLGLPQRMICALLDNCKSVETLTKHYRTELDLGEAQACSVVAGALYKKCLAGDTSAILFWHKTRMGYRENADLSKQDSSIPEPKEIIFTIKDARAEQPPG